MASVPPIPRFSVVLQAKTIISKVWDDWLQTIAKAVNASSVQVGRVSLDTQSASVLTTAVASSLAAGLYRLSYYAQVTRAATVSSSLTTTLTWTYNSLTQTYTSSAMTGNTTTTHQEITFPIRVDASSSVSYALTYASSGATSMQYSFDVSLEAVPS